jgi:hypothetical protein
LEARKWVAAADLAVGAAANLAVPAASASLAVVAVMVFAATNK